MRLSNNVHIVKMQFTGFLEGKHIFIIIDGYNNKRQVTLTDFMVVEFFNNHNFLSQHFINNLILVAYFISVQFTG